MSYTLDPRELNASQRALHKAAEGFRDSISENRVFGELGLFMTIAGVAFALRAATPTGTSFGGARFVRGSADIIAIGAALVMTLLVVVHLRVIRQRLLAKRFGLSEARSSATKIGSRRHLSTKLTRTLATAGGALLGLALLNGMTAERPARLTILFSALIGITCLFAGITLHRRSVKRRQILIEAIADADRLSATLLGIQKGLEPSAAITPSLLEEIADLEQMQINRDRAIAIGNDLSGAKRDYEVAISRDAATRRASLPADRRLEVEQLIERLTVEPYRPTAAGRSRHDPLVARTAPRNGSAAIHYRVDVGRRRIQIVAISAPELETDRDDQS